MMGKSDIKVGNLSTTNSTRASHVVTHRTTDRARWDLTSQSGRDGVQFSLYDRSWKNNPSRSYINTKNNNMSFQFFFLSHFFFSFSFFLISFSVFLSSSFHFQFLFYFSLFLISVFILLLISVSVLIIHFVFNIGSYQYFWFYHKKMSYSII